MSVVKQQYATANIYGGHFYGGNAKNGGNFSFMHDVHVNIYGGIIENGTTTSYGGNIMANATNANRRRISVLRIAIGQPSFHHSNRLIACNNLTLDTRA